MAEPDRRPRPTLVGRARLSGGPRRLTARAPGRRTLTWWRPWPLAAVDPPALGPGAQGGGPPPPPGSGTQAPSRAVPPRVLPGRRTSRRSVTRRDSS
jgi:hypothetical protein